MEVATNKLEFSPSLELFIVMNKEGRYFRAVGYNSYSSEGNWVGDINKAKVYSKLGQARSRVTFFANNYPEYGIPDIIKLTVGIGEYLDETKRVQKVLAAKEKQELANLEQRKRDTILRAQADFDRAQAALNKAKGK